jgi:SAM-dependent methyltransferase
MQVNTVHHGDAESVLAQFPDNAVHVICTSPPYWNQRDYETEGQIGAEPDVQQYIDRLLAIGYECQRVLRDDGSLLLNIGDTYVDGERQLIPFRVAKRLRDEVGFHLREDLVWNKKNTKPDPADDRRSREHEYVFHLTNERDYWYDETVTGGEHGSVITAPTATSQLDHVAVYSEAFVRQCLRGIVPAKVCSECGKPYDREYSKVPRPFCDPDRQQAQRAYELYHESDLTREHVDAIRSVGISDVGKAAQTEDGAGRNADDVEQFAREAKEVLGGYYREFTMVERVPDGYKQACPCDGSAVGAVVCDPFCGSGTTLDVAEELGCQWVGIDINEQYVDVTTERVVGAD